MAKLYFRYGAMGSSKTANALMVQYNYEERGQWALLLKPATDDRDGAEYVGSRIGLKAKAEVVSPETSIVKLVLSHETLPDAIIVDEVQFLSKDQIIELSVLVDTWNVPVICYGLRTTFQGHLFPAIETLMALADTIEEIKTVCWCGRKATMNARVINDEVVFEGPEVLIGGNESYIALCRRHFYAKAHHAGLEKPYLDGYPMED